MYKFQKCMRLFVTYKAIFLSFCDTPETGKVEKSNANPVFGREWSVAVQISSSRQEFQCSQSRETIYPSGSSEGAPEDPAKLDFFASCTFVVL